MTLSLVLNLIFGIAVVLMVVSPLAWAIWAARADERARAQRAQRWARLRLGHASARRAYGRPRLGDSMRPTA